MSDARLKFVGPLALHRTAPALHHTARALRFVAWVACVACITCIASANDARAASFTDYRARVNSALHHATDLFNALDGGGNARAAQSLAALRQTLPPKEHVEWAGGGVDADNTWLHKELDDYAALPVDKLEERKASVSRVVEQLAVLDRQLDEAARPEKTARDKEAEKGRLHTILQRPEYNEQAARGGALERVWEWIGKLIEKLLPRRSPLTPGASGALSLVARVFIYALAAALIIFVAWRYGPAVLNQLSTRRKKRRAAEARVVLGERLAPDESAADLINEAERLARAGDVRAAIRKAYIAVLCELGDRKLIRLAQHKTNRDYLQSVRDRAELYQLMRPLTHDFERHWYGFAPATDADWNQYRSLCRQTLAD
ncbi:MAG: DUF4129 domain-containing protein [Pyrinomonadaceae bacterium]